jgi:hypothetical protein
MITIEIRHSAKRRQVQIKIGSAEAIVLSEFLKRYIFSEIKMNGRYAVHAMCIIEVYQRSLNKSIFPENVSISMSYAEALAFWQLLATENHELIESVCYAIAKVLTQNGIAS